MDPPKDFSENSFSQTQANSDEFSFVSTTSQNTAEITGTLEGNFSSGDTDLHQRKFGNKYTETFLGNKGIGWLLEVEDEDDETFQKPLL